MIYYLNYHSSPLMMVVCVNDVPTGEMSTPYPNI